MLADSEYLPASGLTIGENSGVKAIENSSSALFNFRINFALMKLNIN
jgi:hypothetical protein